MYVSCTVNDYAFSKLSSIEVSYLFCKFQTGVDS